jgi:acetyl-CoA carboxylase biotin carboxyl carrier protein
MRWGVDSKEIREIIELISKSNFASFELEGDGFKLKLVKQTGALPAGVAVGPPTAQPASASAPSPAPTAASSEPVARVEDSGENGLVMLNSPIVGTFYVAPGPDSPPFVEVGSVVKKGQVICIVEAMKVMNEIESEIDAEVAEILVANGQPVEFGEGLFKLRPLS